VGSRWGRTATLCGLGGGWYVVFVEGAAAATAAPTRAAAAPHAGNGPVWADRARARHFSGVPWATSPAAGGDGFRARSTTGSRS